MANSKGPSSFRNFTSTGKQSLLPPKSPFPSIAPSYADYGSRHAIGSKNISNPREGYRHHQRTSSESILIEEQPSWLEELLNEPETPVHRGGHRRSSSDSFAYVDANTAFNLDNISQEEYKFKNLASVSSWGSQDFDHYKDLQQASFYMEPNSFGKQQNRAWESSSSSATYASGLPTARDGIILQSSGLSCTPQETDGLTYTETERQDQEEADPHGTQGSSERKDGSYAKSSASDIDPKRAKQQFAQRSRVRKLQYIAELERNVQALQAEGSEVSAELEFINQQNLILSMENKALKQRLDSLSQEQLIKNLEQQVLEREIGRLRTLYHNQQQQQQPQQQQQKQPSSHRRGQSRDLDTQFANLSLKHREASSGHDPVNGPLHI